MIRWRSPLRGPWLTSVLAVVLLIGLPIVSITGLLSYAAYQPQFRGNAFPTDPGLLRLPHFAWPTDPAWLYRLNQGLHVGLGLILIPVVLAKLWSVIPKLFVWPPARTPAELLERGSLALLVGGILFELATGVLNIQYDYVFGFDFYTGHYYGAFVFLAGFAVHVPLKIAIVRRSLRSRRLRDELRVSTPDTVAEPPDEHGLVPADPDPATISRRGALAVVGGSSALIGLVTVGQSLGDRLRPTAVLSVRGQSYGAAPGDFQVNRTAGAAGITEEMAGGGWRLALRGGNVDRSQATAMTSVPELSLSLSRQDLLAMPQHTALLPIACVEGWSTVQQWSGVRLRDLAALVRIPEPTSLLVESLEARGAFARAVLNAGQAVDEDSLLALRVNGADLSLDHGFPARVIVPALPGVHNTKWVRALHFRSTTGES